MQQEDVFESLSRERAYQDQKWGDLDDSNNVADFLAYMKRYFDKAFEDNNPKYPELSMEHIRKMTALGVAAMEKFGEGLFVSHVNEFRANVIYSPDRKTFDIAVFWTPPVDRRYDGVFISQLEKNEDTGIVPATDISAMGWGEKTQLSMKVGPFKVKEGTVVLFAQSIDKNRNLQPIWPSTPRVKLQIVP